MKFKLVALLLLTVFVGVSYGNKMGVPSEWEMIDVFEYKGSTGQPFTVAWQNVPYDPTNATGWCPLAVFQLKICNEERNTCIWIDKEIPRDAAEYTYVHPRTGHWVAYIRVDQECQLPYRDPTNSTCIGHEGKDDREEGHEYSEWSVSTDPVVAQVNGEPRGWKAFAWLAPPGPLSTINAAKEHIKSYINKGD
jgi:hypothetical protein